MGGDRCVNQGIPLPFLEKLLGIAQHGRFILVIRSGKVDKRLAQHAAHPGGLGFFGNRVFEIVHVAERRYSGTNLFGRRQPRAPAHKFLGDVRGFGGEDVFSQPVIERDVVMQSTKKRHRHVGMPIDKTWHHKLAPGVDGLRASVFGFDLAAWTDRHDRVTFNGYRAIVIDSSGTVHGQHEAAVDDQIHLLFCRHALI